MNKLAALAEQLKKQGVGFSSQPLVNTSYDQPCEFEHWDDTPISDEEFIERLPEKIVDPNTGKEVFISQSKIKKVRDMALGELCPMRLYKTTLVEEVKEEGSLYTAMGRRFEYELSGALDYDGEEPAEILGKTGKPGAEQKRISENAQLGKETFERMGMPIESFSINEKYRFKCLSGSPDLEKDKDEFTLVVDIKYSANIGNKNAAWSEYGWDPEKLPNKFPLIVQPSQYDLLGRLIHGKPVEFMFVVFHSGAGHEGEYLPLKIEISEDRRNQHKNLILHVINEIQRLFKGEGFQAVPAYKKGFCQDCPVKSCRERITHPEIISVCI